MICILVIALVFLVFIIVYQKQVALFLLKNSGWKAPPDELMKIMNENKKLIIVYPHTSHHDGLLMILYKKAYPEFGKHLKFLIRPDITEIPLLGKFLIYNGAIPSTFIQIKNGGRTKEIIEYLNTQNEFHFLISPKGTIRKSEWKTGYYYIAKGTGARVLALGLDYKKGEIVFNEPIENLGRRGDSNDDVSQEKELRKILQTQLQDIPQRIPSNVEY